MSVNPISKAHVGICPGCGARIRFQEVELGEFVVCQECSDELEVVQLNPFRLDWAYADPYDDDHWDDDDPSGSDWDDDNYYDNDYDWDDD